MKKRYVILIAVPGLLAALVLVGPRLLDWGRFVPRVAEPLRAATGWTLEVDGRVDVTLVPHVELVARAIRISNPAAPDAPPLVSARALRGRVDLLALLRRRVEVEELVVEELALALEIDAAGASSWARQAPPEAEGAPEAAEGTALPFHELAIASARVAGGSLRFHSALSGQTVTGEQLDLDVSLTALDHPLSLSGSVELNEEPVTFSARVEPFRALLERGEARLQAQLDSPHLAARFQSELQTEPLLGLDGAGGLDIPSVGALAAWLDVPLESNPGPLRVRTRLRSDGPRVALEEATIEGDHISARASASVELAGDEIRVVADVSSEQLDLDRYLPARDPERPTPPPPADAPSLAETYLAMVPDTPLDLSGLRRLVADVRADVAGIRLGGSEAAPIRLRADGRDGVLEASVEEIGAYRGTVRGSARLDATSDVVVAAADLEVEGLDAGALAEVAYPDAPPVMGTAAARLDIGTEGRTARELARSVTGLVSVDLASGGRIQGVDQLSGLSLTVERPTTDARPRLGGDAVYRGQPLVFDVTVAPLDTVLAGEPVPLDASVDSELLTFRYAGTVYQQPVPSLSGRLDVETDSAPSLVRWLGKTWPGGSAERLALRATLESDGRRGRIEDARLSGDGLDLSASGGFEGDEREVRFDLALRGGVVDLDRYLVPAPPAAGARARGPSALVSSLDDAPVDLGFLRRYLGEVTVAVEELRARAIGAGPLSLSASVERGTVEVRLDRLALADGALAGRARLDATGDLLRAELDARLLELRTARLAAALADVATLAEGEVSATLEATASGRSLRRLATAATARVELRHPGVAFARGPFAALDAIEATLDVPGIDARTRLRVLGTLRSRLGERRFPLDLQALSGTLDELVGARTVALDADASIGATTLTASGRLAVPAETAGTELDLSLESPSIGELWFDTGFMEPDVRPVALAGKARVSAGTLAVDGLSARAGRSDLSGSVAVARGGRRPRITGALRSDRLDLHELMPFDAEAAAAERRARTEYVFTDEPLPLDVLHASDGDVSVEIGRLLLPIGTEIDDISARVALEGGRLQLGPATGRHSGGRTDARLVVDASADPPSFELEGTEEQMLLGTFVPIVMASGDTEGRADVDLRLTASGESPRALAASLDGTVRIVGEGGAVDSQLLGALALDVFDILAPFVPRDGNTSLNCFVARVRFEEGVGTSRALLVDFPTLSIVGTGTVDLASETLDLRFATKAKSPSLAALAVPFSVGGTLSAPRVRPEPTTALVRGVATLFNPVAALGALATIGTGRILGENPCIVAMREAAEAAAGGGEETEPEEGRGGFRPFRRLFGGG